MAKKKRTRQFVKSKQQLLKEQEEQRKKELNRLNKQQSDSNKKKILLYGTVLAIFVLIFTIGIRAYSNRNSQGQWDNFAQCLTDSGAIMYGNMYTCKYSQHQGGMFGSSFKFINYKDSSENPDVKITPTWYINGEILEGEQSFETLSEKTGCSLY